MGLFSALGLQTSKTMWISNATWSFWLEFSNLEERKQSRRHSTVCNNRTEIGKKLSVWIVRPAFQRKIQELSKQHWSPAALGSLLRGKGPLVLCEPASSTLQLNLHCAGCNLQGRRMGGQLLLSQEFFNSTLEHSPVGHLL